MNFNDGLKLVLELEGGKADVPGDRGGRTAHGITQATYDEWREDRDLPSVDVWKITQTEVEAIYSERYWYATGCDKIPGRLAVAAFQAAVHSGPAKARGWLAAVRWAEALEECQVFAFLSLQRDFLMRLAQRDGQEKFRRGWENRISKTLAFTMRVV